MSHPQASFTDLLALFGGFLLALYGALRSGGPERALAFSLATVLGLVAVAVVVIAGTLLATVLGPHITSDSRITDNDDNT